MDIWSDEADHGSAETAFVNDCNNIASYPSIEALNRSQTRAPKRRQTLPCVASATLNLRASNVPWTVENYLGNCNRLERIANSIPKPNTRKQRYEDLEASIGRTPCQRTFACILPVCEAPDGFRMRGRLKSKTFPITDPEMQQLRSHGHEAEGFEVNAWKLIKGKN